MIGLVSKDGSMMDGDATRKQNYQSKLRRNLELLRSATQR